MKLKKGDRFNHWTYLGKALQRPRYGVFKCDCGKIKEVFISSVTCGTSLSCGNCKHITRGLSQKDYHFLIAARSRALQRCDNPKSASYARYGARGIDVCDEWRESVSAFVDWSLANGWEKGLSLDRIDNDGNYSPNNCRWADTKMQGRNKSTCIYFTHDDKKRCMSEWCEIYGIPHYLAFNRYSRGAKDFETIFFVGDLGKR